VSEQPIRAISIRQPWVELILRGVKKKEYRSQPTNIRERVYLYASAKRNP
jgi:predicted transcriptional regulator